MAIRVSVNGEPVVLPDVCTVAQLVASRTEQQRRVAVALNGAVVPRSGWQATVLTSGDTVEVLMAVAGG